MEHKRLAQALRKMGDKDTGGINITLHIDMGDFTQQEKSVPDDTKKDEYQKVDGLSHNVS